MLLNARVGMLALILGCRPAEAPVEAIPGTQVQMDFAGSDFYSRPFPSDERRTEDGRPDVSDFPNLYQNAFVEEMRQVVEVGADGFGMTSAVYFSLDAGLGTVPTLSESIEEDATIFLINVDSDSPEYGKRHPVEIVYVEDGGPHGTPHQLSLLPLQGVPLRPTTRYAAVVLREARDAEGELLGVSKAMAQLAVGQAPEGLDGAGLEAYTQGLLALADLGVEPSSIAGLAVYTTGDPLRGLRAMLADAQSRALPEPSSDWELTETFDSFCVYHATIPVPTYQTGEPPYLNAGGVIEFDGETPVFQRTEDANVWVTIPRAATPANGWPVVVMIPTGGGGDRPLVDRGVHAVPHGESIEPGSGPGKFFAEAGYAGMSIDGPHDGLRNVSGGDGQLLMFNFGNPAAMLDNFRELDYETALWAEVAPTLSIDASGCEGASDQVGFDGEQVALFGHSMGATSAVPAFAIQPKYRGLVLSGAGGSWLENILYKQSPFEIKPLAEAVVGYAAIDRELTRQDPLMSLVQWAGEATDPPVFAPTIALDPPDGETPRSVLMFQGIVDTYILPPIANPLSLALGADLAGGSLDVGVEEFSEFTPLSEVLVYSNGEEVELPVSGNAANGTATVVVVQHLEDGIEDGHETVFQTEGPKVQYVEFLRSLRAEEVPTVP